MDTWIGSLLIVLIGLLVGSIFLTLGFILKKRINNYRQTNGIIVSNYLSRYTTVEFKDGDGKTYQHKMIFGSPSLPMKRGKKVTVFYNPVNPHQSLIDSFTARGILFFLIGILVIVFGFVGAFFLYYIGTMVSNDFLQ